MRAFVMMVLSGLLAPAAAMAGCQGELLLSCPIAGSDKHLDMCLDGDELVYSYGRPGSPELILYDPLSAGTYTPWNGIGRTMWDAVTFTNEGYTYTVGWSVDRMDETLPISAGVTVEKGGQFVADLRCAEGSDLPEFGSVLMDAMQGIGLCWDPSAQAWSGTACQE